MINWSLLAAFLSHLLLLRENLSVDVLKAAQWVYRSTLTLWGLEEILSPWVKPLIRILSWSTSSSAACRRVSLFTIWSLGVLLLHMCVKSGI